MTTKPDAGSLAWDMHLAVEQCFMALETPLSGTAADRIRSVANLLLDLQDRVIAFEDHFGRPYSAQVVRLRPMLAVIEGGSVNGR